MTLNKKLEICKIILLSLIFITVLYSTISTERYLKKANRFAYSTMMDEERQVDIQKDMLKRLGWIYDK
ncbi:hypothetical protein N8381_00705 [Oceanospirillaceae bacterium]|nr:hypothetical protein [Oceanospirillaceae bacterium]